MKTQQRYAEFSAVSETKQVVIWKESRPVDLPPGWESLTFTAWLQLMCESQEVKGQQVSRVEFCFAAGDATVKIVRGGEEQLQSVYGTSKTEWTELLQQAYFVLSNNKDGGLHQEHDAIDDVETRDVGAQRQPQVELAKAANLPKWSCLGFAAVAGLQFMVLGIGTDGEMQTRSTSVLWLLLEAFIALVVMAEFFFVARLRKNVMPVSAVEVVDILVLIACTFDSCIIGWLLPMHQRPLRAAAAARAAHRVFREAKHGIRPGDPLHELRLVLSRIAPALRGALCSAVLFFIFLYWIAVFATTAVGFQSHQFEGDVTTRRVSREQIEAWFGTVPKSLFTILRLATLDGWGNIIEAVCAELPIAGVLLGFMVPLLALAIAGVVTGIMSEAVVVALQDLEVEGRRVKRQAFQEAFNCITTSLDQAISDGCIIRVDLETLLAHKDSLIATEILKEFHLPPPQVLQLFDMLDVQGHGKISVAEFMMSLVQLQGFSDDTSDDVELHCEVQKLKYRLKSIEGNLSAWLAGQVETDSPDVSRKAGHGAVEQKLRRSSKAPSSAGETGRSPSTQAARASETSGSHLTVGSDAQSKEANELREALQGVSWARLHLPGNSFQTISGESGPGHCQALEFGRSVGKISFHPAVEDMLRGDYAVGTGFCSAGSQPDQQQMFPGSHQFQQGQLDVAMNDADMPETLRSPQQSDTKPAVAVSDVLGSTQLEYSKLSYDSTGSVLQDGEYKLSYV